MISCPDFHAECRQHWQAAIADVVGPACPTSATWRGASNIQRVLKPSMGSDRNHAHLPSGGEMDFQSVDDDGEAGCLGFHVDARVAYVGRPRSLTLEVFSDAVQETFLLMELEPLPVTGLGQGRAGVIEEVFEHPMGSYRSRDIWEQGCLGYDDRGQEIPLPADSRLAVRMLGGKVLLVCKGSTWNSKPETYDGRHERMPPAEIRAAIVAMRR